MNKVIAALSVMLLMLAVACSSEDTNTTAVSVVDPTSTPSATYTPEPTSTATPIPEPTPTVAPTSTPEPTATATIVPTPTSTSTPTATPTQTPIPLTVDMSITKLPVWDYRGTPDWKIAGEDPPDKWAANLTQIENCFDFQLTNDNEHPIRFAFSLKAFDEDGVSYPRSHSSQPQNALSIKHLPIGETYLDRRCWRDAPYYGEREFEYPVSRMEATLEYIEVSTLFDGWQKIGGAREQLADIRINSEPSLDENYPNVYDFHLYPLGKWQVANVSESKTYSLNACTAYKWKDSEMFENAYTETAYAYSTHVHAQNIKPGTFYNIVCAPIELGPKEAGDITASIYPGNSYQGSLYQDPLGVWVKEVFD
jgi:hypothetical protein